MRKQEIAHSLLALVLSVGALGLLASHNFLRADMTDAVALYVSPTGNDSDDGSEAHPLLTVNAAKTKTRQLRSGGQTGPVTIYLRAGRYFQSSALSFTSQDSGTALAPTTYRNYPGEEAIITGSKMVTGFSQVTDPAILARLNGAAQAAVQVVNLPSLGITDYGTLENRGGFMPTRTAALELFFNDNRMQLARYPNSGWDYLGAGTSGVTNGFQYTDPRPANWPTYNDVFVNGLFGNTWADETYKIGSINTTEKTITIAGTPDSYGFRAGQWFFYNNVFDELDAAGEYYLDRSTGNLYFWPPSDPSEATVTVTLSNKLVGANNVSYVQFQGISFQGTRARQIEITNSHHLNFSDSSFLGAGNDAVKLYNVTNTVVANNIFNQTAERGLYIIGGDRSSLVSSGNVVINNTFHDTSQIVRTGRAALEFSGVGMKILHNEFHNIPQVSVRMHGNDNLVSYNYFHDSITLVPPNTQTADVGVVYIGRDYTEQGNVISKNKFVDIGAGHMISGAVYLDDGSSGTLVEKNFFDNVGRAFILGGGRYNTFDNNVVVNSTQQMVFDSRGYQSPTRSEWMANKFYNPISAASNTAPIIITTTNHHGLVTGSVTAPPTITVTGVEGNTAANGTWSYEVVSPNQLRLLNSVGNGDYTTGGDMRSIYGNIDFYAALDAVHYSGSPYEKYAHIFDYSKYDLGNPVGDTFTRNILYFGNKSADTWVRMYPSTPPFFSPENNIVHGSNDTPTISGTNSNSDPLFVSPLTGDYHLQSGSPAFGLGFQELPHDKMGRLSGDKLLVKPNNQTVAIQNELRMTITAPYFADEATNPTYTFDSLPNGANFDRQTRTLTWTPAAFQVGTYDFALTVSDDYLNAATSFSVTVTDPGRSGGGNSGTATATPTPTEQGTGTSQTGTATATATSTAQASGTGTSVASTPTATASPGTPLTKTLNSPTPDNQPTATEGTATPPRVDSPTSGTSAVKSNTQENLPNTTPVKTIIEQQEQELSRAARMLTTVLTIVIILDLLYLLIWAGRLMMLRIRPRPPIGFPPETPPQI